MAKTAAERKTDQRKREAEHRAMMEAELFSMDIYKGTREALERIMAAGEFEEAAEALTVLIHNTDEILKCDMSQVDCLLNVTWLRSRELPSVGSK